MWSLIEPFPLLTYIYRLTFGQEVRADNREAEKCQLRYLGVNERTRAPGWKVPWKVAFKILKGKLPKYWPAPLSVHDLFQEFCFQVSIKFFLFSLRNNLLKCSFN